MRLLEYVNLKFSTDQTGIMVGARWDLAVSHCVRWACMKHDMDFIFPGKLSDDTIPKGCREADFSAGLMGGQFMFVGF